MLPARDIAKATLGVLNEDSKERGTHVPTLQARIAELETALRTCIARAGAPDPVEACRLVIRTAEEALGPR